MGITIYENPIRKDSLIYKRESLRVGDAGWYSERGISKDLEYIKCKGWGWAGSAAQGRKSQLLCPSELTEW